MVQVLLLLLIVYAACGLALSLAIHLAALAGFQPPGGNSLFVALHVGIFPLWIPVVLIGMKMTKGTRLSATWGWSGWNLWNSMFSACPPWMKYMVYGFFIYAVLNFVLFVASVPTGKFVGSNVPSAAWRGFSGHWMVFYSAGLAILTSAHRKGISNLEPRCSNGHSIGFGDKFCPTCGTPINDQPR